MTDLETLRQQFDRDLAAAASEADLRAVRDRYLSRKGGLVSTLLKALGRVGRGTAARSASSPTSSSNDIDRQLTERLDSLSATRPPAGAVDVTLPGRRPLLGHRHPLTILRERIEAIFTRFGFLVIEGPELEDDYHNFEALNMPPEHPARDMQDTLYLASRAIRGGRAGDAAAHAHVGHADPLHGEAPAAGPADRPGPRLPSRRLRPDAHADVHAGRRAGRRRGGHARGSEGHADRVRARAVRPGAEDPLPSELLPVHRTERRARHQLRRLRRYRPCCGMCKRTGWIEILGSGMVHPAVFEAVGYDPERYTGFAFGIGIERLALLKWGVEDIRLFYENDLRFLEQFPL